MKAIFEILLILFALLFLVVGALFVLNLTEVVEAPPTELDIATAYLKEAPTYAFDGRSLGGQKLHARPQIFVTSI